MCYENPNQTEVANDIIHWRIVSRFVDGKPLPACWSLLRRFKDVRLPAERYVDQYAIMASVAAWTALQLA